MRRMVWAAVLTIRESAIFQPDKAGFGHTIVDARTSSLAAPLPTGLWERPHNANSWQASAEVACGPSKGFSPTSSNNPASISAPLSGLRRSPISSFRQQSHNSHSSDGAITRGDGVRLQTHRPPFLSCRKFERRREMRNAKWHAGYP